MAGLQGLSSGPSRAVIVLCITQILGWGALFYPPGLTMPHIAAAHGWSLAQSLLGFSIAMGVSGLVAPFTCSLIERHGGHYIMSGGALIGALGLLILPFASHYGLYLASWVLLGVAMACNLYDPALRRWPGFSAPPRGGRSRWSPLSAGWPRRSHGRPHRC